ncbi:MAG TPA: glycosyltransferase [Thermoanaerobaculia bacterium]|nr:glycosyltransferase [Thermoanaerobaculia bacterium]
MKVLFVSGHCLDGTAEGLASARLAGALARHGHEVTLLTRKQSRLPIGVEGHLLEPEPFHRFNLDRWGRLGALPHLLRGCTAEEKGWVRAVARKAAELGPFDVLHSRLNPAASHLAALAVLKKIELPWCAYFSDPWPHHLYPEPYRFTVGPLSRRRLELSLDTMLRRADSLVFPSNRLRDWLLSGRRERFRSKSFVAPHLGEEGASSPASNGHLHIRHAGFLMKERRIEPLLAALERLRPEVKRDLRIELAGRYAVQPEVPAPLSGIVSFEPSMPPEAVRAWMAGADVALLVEASLAEGIFFPSKLSDYLAGGRAILALSPRRGVTADLLAGGGGVLVEPEDEAGIAAALERLHGLWREGRLAELAPRPEQAAAVAEDTVVPVYERAFQEARR